jgi:glycine/D-amino acid oxidase-like deaminating enzyme
MPGRPGLFLACGHEGLGITTAPATAELIVSAILGRPAPMDPAPFLPGRFPELNHA